jgi:hypothetical protein
MCEGQGCHRCKVKYGKGTNGNLNAGLFTIWRDVDRTRRATSSDWPKNLLDLSPELQITKSVDEWVRYIVYKI